MSKKMIVFKLVEKKILRMTEKLEEGDIEFMHSYERMIVLFMDVDKNGDGEVSKDELKEYYKTHKVEDNFIDDWLKKYDENKDGKITAQEFAKGIGLTTENLKELRKEIIESRQIKLEDGVQIIHSTMSRKKQKEVTDHFIKSYDDEKESSGALKDDGLNDVAKKMKAFLDQNYGKVWQCICMQGSYALSFAHQPFSSVQFSYKNYICLAWCSHKVVQ